MARTHNEGDDMRIHALMTAAANLIQQRAEEISAQWPNKRQWTAEEVGAMLDYANHKNIADALRAAASYFEPNPLGGPAKLFDAVADSIRAGDSVDDAMRNFGLRWDDNITQRHNVGVEPHSAAERT